MARFQLVIFIISTSVILAGCTGAKPELQGSLSLSAMNFSGKSSASYDVTSLTDSVMVSASCDKRITSFEASVDQSNWQTLESLFPGADVNCADKNLSFTIDPVGSYLTTLGSGSQVFYVRGKTIIGWTDPNVITVNLVAPTALTVNIEQNTGQSDPTNDNTIEFIVTFSHAIDAATFTAADITNDASGTFAGSLSWAITQNSSTEYLIIGTAGTGTGTVIPNLAAGLVENSTNSVSNDAATGTDRSVLFDNEAPVITAMGLLSPASSPGTDTTPTFRVTYPSAQGVAQVQLFQGATCLAGLHSTVTSPGATQTDITSSVIAAQGSYSFGVKVQDALGNLSGCQGVTTYALDFAPTVTNVTASTADGLRGMGSTIQVEVVFSEAVNVTGTPLLLLETGAVDNTAAYSSGTGTNTLVFQYTVAAGDQSSDLNYKATTSLSLNGGTIRDADNGTNDDAVLTLPALAGAGSLATNKAIQIDGIRPTSTCTAPTSYVLTDSPTATGTCSDTGPAAAGTYDCSFDGGSWGSCTASALPEGIRQVEVRCTDTAGNVQTTSYGTCNFTVDFTPPTVSAGSFAGIPTGSNVLSSFSMDVINSDIKFFQYKVGIASIDCTSASGYTGDIAVTATTGAGNYEIDNLALGSMGSLKICIRARDLAGNWTPLASAYSQTWTRMAPAELTITEADPYDYGTVAVGGTRDWTFTITNTGGVAATGISETGLSGPFVFPGGTFPGTGGTCNPSGINSLSDCTIVVRYAPSGTGADTDSIVLEYNNGVSASQTVSRDIQGVGAAPASLGISDGPAYNFGSIIVGNTPEKIITVSNSGSVAASAMTGSGLDAPFSFKGGNYPGIGGDCGGTLAVAGSCTLVVVYNPGNVSSHTDEINISYHNGAAPDSTTRVLNGTGVLGGLDQIDDANDATGFGGGIKAIVSWVTGAFNRVELNSTQFLGYFHSRIFNGGNGANWTSLSWIPTSPSRKALPNAGGAESGYAEGNVNMSGVGLLLHFDDTSWTPGSNTAFTNNASTPTNIGDGVGNVTSTNRGRFNRAIKIGDGGYAKIGDNANWTPPVSGPFSFEFWMRPDRDYSEKADISSAATLLTKGNYSVQISYPDTKLHVEYAREVFSPSVVYNAGGTGVISMGQYRGYLYAGSTGSGANLHYCSPDGTGACNGGAWAGPLDLSSGGIYTGIKSMAVYLDTLYIGMQGATAAADIQYCTVSGVACDTPGEWATSFDSSTASDVYVHSMVVHKGILYAAFQSGTNGFIKACNPTATGAPTICESTDWMTVYTISGRRSVFSLLSMNGALYASSGNGTANTATVSYCASPGADGICNTEWALSQVFSTSLYSESYTDALTLGAYMGKLYVGFSGATAGRGDIIVCNPDTAGNANVCDSPLDWCNATVAGSPTTCDSTSDGLANKVYDSTGTYEWVESLAVHGSVFYVGLGGSAASAGQIKKCQTTNPATPCTSWSNVGSSSPSHTSAEVMTVLNGKLYAGFYGSADIKMLDAGSSAKSSNNQWIKNKWYHIVASYSSGTLSLYVNGVFDSSVTLFGTAQTSTGLPLLFGQGYGTTGDFQPNDQNYLGAIDEFAFYNRAFSASEVMDRYARGINQVLHQVRSCADPLCRDRILDTTFNMTSNSPNLTVSSLVMSGTTLIAAGSFTSPVSKLVAYNMDGTLNTTFNSNIGANVGAGNISNLYISPHSGKIYVVGSFTLFNGNACNHAVRLHPNGTFDTCISTGTGFNGQVVAVAEEENGTIWAGGLFTSYNGTSINRLVKLKSDFTIDPIFSINFGTGLNSSVGDIELDSYGGIYVGGDFTFASGSAVNRLVRYNVFGQRDPSFNPPALSSYVSDIELGMTGKLYVGGDFASKLIALSSQDGSVDVSFSPTINFTIYRVVEDHFGKLHIGGFFTSVNGTNLSRWASLNTDGTTDSSFSTFNGRGPTADAVRAIAISTSGDIFIGGNFLQFNDGLSTKTVNRIARLHTNAGFTGGLSGTALDGFSDSDNTTTGLPGVANFALPLSNQYFQYRSIFIQEGAANLKPGLQRMEIYPTR